MILQQELLSENVRNSSPYRRLKLVMDYWCALCFFAAVFPASSNNFDSNRRIKESN